MALAENLDKEVAFDAYDEDDTTGVASAIDLFITR